MKPNKHIMKKTNLKYEAKNEIQTHTHSRNHWRRILVVLSRESYMVGKTSDKSYNKKVSFSFSHLGIFGEGAWLCISLRSIALRERIGKQKRVCERERATCWTRVPGFVRNSLFPSHENNPNGSKAIIKTSNEFYVCASCGVSPPPFQNPIVSVFSRVSPVVAWNRFSFLWIGRFPRVDISAIDRRHPRRAQFRANLEVKRKKNLTNSISSHQKMFNKQTNKKCIVFCTGCCCRKIMR